jgi:hypothetical protein
MDPALKTLKAALEAIRDTTTNAVDQIALSPRDVRCDAACMLTATHSRPVVIEC